ncbi:hypothetical protein [Streptomyces sp. NPDC050759]|uniref:hypothetical protein n=1 Tax=Streptomyces sp. NPDC050759 TaxID=3365635 RepID=UPI0037AD9BA1
MVQRLVQRQINTGHGGEGFTRIIESIKQPGGEVARADGPGAQGALHPGAP